MHGQKTIDLYLNKVKAKQNGNLYYAKTLRIISDSTFVLNTYQIKNKKELRKSDFKEIDGKYIPITTGGTYTKSGMSYLFNYGRGRSVRVKGILKNNGNKIIILSDWENNTIEKKSVFKKVKSGMD